jgi:hypothetical protein
MRWRLTNAGVRFRSRRLATVRAYEEDEPGDQIRAADGDLAGVSPLVARGRKGPSNGNPGRDSPLHR